MNNSIELKYSFKPQGFQVDDKELGKEIYVDIGNDLRKGVIDHHQINNKDKKSTVAVFEYKYVEHLINEDSVTVYTHFDPDMDAILSTFMVKTALTKSEEEYNKIFGEKGYCKGLMKYVNRIDSGFGKKITVSENGKIEKITPYILCCFFEKLAYANHYYEEEVIEQNRESWTSDFKLDDYKESLNDKEKEKCDELILKMGHILIENILLELERTPEKEVSSMNFDWPNPENNIQDDVIKYIQRELSNDYEKYLEEKENHQIDFRDIYVWEKNLNGDGNINYIPSDRKVRAAIWRKKPESEFSYIYARSTDNAIVTFVPKGTNIDKYDRTTYGVNISVYPEKAGEISLKPLAQMLELYEQVAEGEYFQRYGEFRRDHSRSRENLEESPFGVTKIPWFYTPDELLVATPSNYSVLSFDEMINILSLHTRQIKNVLVKNVSSDNDVSESIKKDMSISSWIVYVQKLINKNKDDFTVVLTEISAELIREKNTVLKLLCNSILGNNIHNEGNILELDYSSCCYVNDNFMHILLATEDFDERDFVRKKDPKQEYVKALQAKYSGYYICSLIDDIDRDYLTNIFAQEERIAKTLTKQKNELNQIRQNMKNAVGNDNKSKEIYKRYVEFLASEQEHDANNKLIYTEIYEYAKNRLHIDEAKEAVKDAVDIVSEYSKEKTYGIFNLLSAITVPFVIISTLFQMGLLKLQPIMELAEEDNKIHWGNGVVNIVSWIVVLLITIGVISWLRKPKK